MTDWKTPIDASHPCWDGYRGLLDALPGDRFPDPRRLNALLPPEARVIPGHPVRFVPADELPAVDYEWHVHASGEVATRPGWHDLFNALAWCRLTRFKAALNALHAAHLDEAADGRRGPQRDALTLLDESGVVVAGEAAELFAALSARDWRQAFVERRADWARVRVVVCGHGLLEKFLAPYKALTAHALLLPVPAAADDEALDARLASALLDEARVRTPADLQPLPLMGIPGWWPGGVQDEAFYADRGVFRAPRAKP